LPNIKGIFETLKKVKHSSPRPKFCPKCKRHNIFPRQAFGILPLKYQCRDCGYEGTLVLELEPVMVEKDEKK
jgi:ribosomal protein L37AE/L43A